MKGSRSSEIRESKLEGEEDFKSGLGEVEIREGLWLLVMAGTRLSLMGVSG